MFVVVLPLVHHRGPLRWRRRSQRSFGSRRASLGPRDRKLFIKAGVSWRAPCRRGKHSESPKKPKHQTGRVSGASPVRSAKRPLPAPVQPVGCSPSARGGMRRVFLHRRGRNTGPCSQEKLGQSTVWPLVTSPSWLFLYRCVLSGELTIT